MKAREHRYLPLLGIDKEGKLEDTVTYHYRVWTEKES
jgi:hypothetical protein